MKKSFMTRALAMGLSVAMAFSLSTATNVTMASAAAKPAMKSTSFKVVEGASAKTYKATTKTAKKYTIVKAESLNPKKVEATVKASKKAIKLSAVGTKFGAAKVEITFKNKETGKKTSIKFAGKAVEADKATITATQTGVKQITVATTFDATNSTVTLSNGSKAVEIATPSISADGKSIVINTIASLVSATYTVKVDDVAVDVVAEASKVDKIEFLSDKAALKRMPGDGATRYTGAVVGYQVLNQFGDDITKTVSLTANASCGVTVSPSTHMITFQTGSANGFMLGRDVITVSLLDTTSAVNASATLAVSAESYAADLEFAGVYNADGKTLTEDTVFTNDAFYALFSAKDQYGYKYNDYKNIVEGSDLYLTVIGGMTGLGKGSDGATFIVLNKDGVDYLAYPFGWVAGITPSTGTATVQLLSSGGGTCSGEIVIGEGERVVSLTVAQNGVIVAGEKNELSYTALDAAGKEVTSYKQLRNIDISGGTTGYILDFVRQADGSAKLILDASSATVAKDNTTMLSYSFKTLNNKFATALLQVSENARPVAIDGLRDIDTTISSKTTYVPVKVKNLMIEDQYGRIVPDWQVANMINASTSAIYCLKEVTAKVSANGVIGVTGAAVTAANNTTAAAISGSAVTKDFVLFHILPGVKGTDVVTFQITNGASGNAQLADASVNVNFTVKDTTSATVATATADSVYVVTDSAIVSTKALAYAQHVKVKANGALLSADDYTVSAPGDMTVVLGSIDGTVVWDVYCNKGQNQIKEFTDKTATTLTRTLTVTLNGTGEKINVDVVIDSTSPKITSVSDLTGDFTPANGDVIGAGSIWGGFVTASRFADQYGKTVTNNGDGTFTFADGSSATASYTFVCTVPLGEGAGAPSVLTGNNTKDASMTVNTGFAGATLTINFGGTTSDVKVNGF